jgi:hypothetical protein
MRRIFFAVVTIALNVSAVLWLLNGTATPSFASSEQVETSEQATVVHVMPDYKTVADTVPRIVITKSGEILGEGYYFVANHGIGNSNSQMIVNESAQLVYYRPIPNQTSIDFKKQPDGTLSYYDDLTKKFVVLDNNYIVTKTWSAGNGYLADHHDLQVLPNGNVALLIYDRQTVDLSVYGGQSNAQVIDLIVQELDQNNDVVFEWNSRDHFQFTDTYMDLTAAVVDYAHGNAVELDVDGNFLISSRNMSEITKIDRSTGDIIWRMGGKNNEFNFIGDTVLPGVGTFSFQYDIRRLPNGNITIFDNGNQFLDAGWRSSRGIEYVLDEVNKTATLVREYRTVPDTFSPFMGNMQRLSNGNTVVGWGGGTIPPAAGQRVALSEFTPDGNVALSLSFLDGATGPGYSYRAFKFPWQGYPTAAPLLVADTGSLPATLYYSWNGATEVSSYDIYGGITPDDLALIAQQPKIDFEDSTPITDITGGLCFFQVTPLNQSNEALRASNKLYLGDAACANGLTADGIQTASRAFTNTQSAGIVTTTLTVFPGEFLSPMIVVRTPLDAALASMPSGQVASDVRFGLRAFQGETLNALSVFTDPVQLAIHYGALDLTRNPSDTNLLRWDETLQSWTDEGIKLLQREVVNQQLIYAVDRAGEFALFVANEAPQSAPVSILMDEDESFTFSADIFPYFDPDGDDFTSVLFGTVPVSGSLLYAGMPISPSQAITVGSLSSLVFTPDADQFGLPYVSFAYAVSDGIAESEPYTFTISVKPVNDAPVAVDDQVAPAVVIAAEPANGLATTISIPVLENDYDVDGDMLKILATTERTQGATEISDEVILYTPTPGHVGTDTFTYTIDDGHGGQGTATVTILLSPKQQYLPLIP